MRSPTDNLSNSSFPERQFEGFLFTGPGFGGSGGVGGNLGIIMYTLIQVEVKKVNYNLQFAVHRIF